MKNYTSEVPPERTVAQIEAFLIGKKAGNISKEYVDELVVSLSFTMKNPETGLPITIRLPANVEGVAAALRKKAPRSDVKTIKRQAARTAWRLMKDWVEVQMSLVEMQQAELIEVFLPYIWSGGKTLFAAFKETRPPGLGFKENS